MKMENCTRTSISYEKKNDKNSFFDRHLHNNRSNEFILKSYSPLNECVHLPFISLHLSFLNYLPQIRRKTIEKYIILSVNGWLVQLNGAIDEYFYVLANCFFASWTSIIPTTLPKKQKKKQKNVGICCSHSFVRRITLVEWRRIGEHQLFSDVQIKQWQN